MEWYREDVALIAGFGLGFLPRPILFRRKSIDAISTKVFYSNFFQGIPVFFTDRLLLTSFHIFSHMTALYLIFTHLLEVTQVLGLLFIPAKHHP